MCIRDSNYPLANTGYWRVEIRPNYPWGPGAYGSPRMIAVTNTSASQGMQLETELDAQRIEEISEPHIFPNPTLGNEFNIDGSAEGEVRIEIYGLTGSLVHSERFVSDGPYVRRLDIEKQLAQGSYLVRIAEPGGLSSYVWIVE